MLGAGVTSTVAELAALVSAIEVAVTVMLTLADTDAGELYVAELDVLLVNVPQAVPVSPAPEQLQLTPSSLESLATVAVNFTACPASMLTWASGEMETVIAGGGGVILILPPPPPPPHPQVIAKMPTTSQSLFIGSVPPPTRNSHPRTRSCGAAFVPTCFPPRIRIPSSGLSAGGGQEMREFGGEFNSAVGSPPRHEGRRRLARKCR